MGSEDVRQVLRALTPALADLPKGRPISSLGDKYAYDEKLDGVRMLAALDRDGLILKNRNGADRTATYPDLSYAATETLSPGIILDGEVVSVTRKFQDVAKRDRAVKAATVGPLVPQIPVQFVAFDVLALDGESTRALPYVQRRELLDSLGLNGRWWLTSRFSHDPALFDQIRAEGGEGVIAKRLTSPYPFGRSPGWLKYKTTRSVTCVAYGYELGEGSRAHMGAILLAMVGPGGITVVGKAGTGFSVKAADDMKAILDRAGRKQDITLLPVVEIECLGLTRERLLRQPVYKGIRTDRTMADAQVDQLDNLPTT